MGGRPADKPKPDDVPILPEPDVRTPPDPDLPDPPVPPYVPVEEPPEPSEKPKRACGSVVPGGRKKSPARSRRGFSWCW